MAFLQHHAARATIYQKKVDWQNNLNTNNTQTEHSYNVYCVAKDLSFLMMDGVTDISKEVSDGTYKKENVPNISNLQEIVFKVLEGKVE